MENKPANLLLVPLEKALRGIHHLRVIPDRRQLLGEVVIALSRDRRINNMQLNAILVT